MTVHQRGAVAKVEARLRDRGAIAELYALHRLGPVELDYLARYETFQPVSWASRIPDTRS